ncbi:hypothetical protein ACF0H5_009625 [Mactra antiquata]
MQSEEITVCGGNLRESPSTTESRHQNRRSLRIMTRSLHFAKDSCEDILSYYVTDMNVMLEEISIIETTCASSIVPEINEDTTFSNVVEELPSDYEQLISILSAVQYVSSHTNDVRQANNLLRLENIIHDLLCTLNNVGFGSGILLPRRIYVDDITLPEVVTISGLRASCNIQTIFNRRQIYAEILRLSENYFESMLQKYVHHSRSIL